LATRNLLEGLGILPTLEGSRVDHRDLSRVEAFLRERGIDYVTYQDWKMLDQYEFACVYPLHRPFPPSSNVAAWRPVWLQTTGGNAALLSTKQAEALWMSASFL
jgi:hypothetical protein